MQGDGDFCSASAMQQQKKTKQNKSSKSNLQKLPAIVPSGGQSVHRVRAACRMHARWLLRPCAACVHCVEVCASVYMGTALASL